MTQEDWEEYANIFKNLMRLQQAAATHKANHLRSMYEVMEIAVLYIIDDLLQNGVSANEQINFLIGYGFSQAQIQHFV